MRVALFIILLAVSGCAPDTSSGRVSPPLHVWVSLTGSSMLPAYAVAGYVEVDINYPFERVKVGDDVMFWDYMRTGRTQYTFHRVVEVGDGYLITQGVNRKTNPNPDQTRITPANYEGKATGRHAIVLLPPIQDSP